MANNFDSVIANMKADGLISPTPLLEQAWLYRCARVFSGIGDIVELGTHYGATAIVLAQAIRDSQNNSQVMTVEILPKTVEIADGNIVKFGFSEIISVIPGDDADVLGSVPDSSIAMIYVDSCHNGDHVANILRFMPWKVIPGGLICGHDYAPWEAGVVKAVSEWRDNMLNLITGFSVYKTTWWALRCCQV